jgi:phosphatidate cytidylyltransferase
MISGDCLVVLGLPSSLALREFVTMTPTRRGDHGTPLQSSSSLRPFNMCWSRLAGTGSSRFYSVYAFLFVPLRSSGRRL